MKLSYTQTKIQHFFGICNTLLQNMQNDCNFITKFVIWLAFMQNYLYLCNRKGEK